MRGLAVACSFIALVCVVKTQSRNKHTHKIHTRPILADELRDFPGVCFASTQCGTVEVGRSWELSPFCGRSTCAKGDDGRLVEVVEDCGTPPGDGCTLDKHRTNSTAPFPDCCPVYDCQEEETYEEGSEEEGAKQEEAEEPQREPAPRRTLARGRGFSSRIRGHRKD